MLADITAEAGLPAGVFNVVQGTGVEAGAPLTAHPGINRLCFHRLGPDLPAPWPRPRPATSCRSPSSSAASRHWWSSRTPTWTSP
ncbi:MAG: aldehyde dehydrogenase family protein [Nocardioides sp.]